ncbi:MAG: flagellar protein FlgN [Gammaproteobacteria bacterium]
MAVAQVERELAVITQLHQLLLDEYQALRARCLADLRSVTSAKKKCLAELQALVERRIAVGGDFQSAVATTDPSEHPRLSQLWTELVNAGIQVRRQNAINGSVIAQSQSHVQQLLAILHGEPAQDCVYDQVASLSHSKTSRVFATA